MNKIKISQDVELGKVLSEEEMKLISINGKTSDKNFNCACSLHIAGLKRPMSGGTSNKRNENECASSCSVKCRQTMDCYDFTYTWIEKGYGGPDSLPDPSDPDKPGQEPDPLPDRNPDEGSGSETESDNKNDSGSNKGSGSGSGGGSGSENQTSEKAEALF